jgi:hypothetical protein
MALWSRTSRSNTALQSMAAELLDVPAPNGQAASGEGMNGLPSPELGAEVSSRRGMRAGPLPFRSTPAAADVDPWAPPRLPPPGCSRTRSWGRATGAAGRGDGGEDEEAPATAPPSAAAVLGGAPSEGEVAALEFSRPWTGSWLWSSGSAPEPDFIAAGRTCVAIPGNVRAWRRNV